MAFTWMMYNSLNLIHAEFVVGSATIGECDDILSELDKLSSTHPPSYSGYLTDKIKFSVLYNEDDDEAFEQLFFKLHLKYPEFRKIRTEKSYTIRG